MIIELGLQDERLEEEERETKFCSSKLTFA